MFRPFLVCSLCLKRQPEPCVRVEAADCASAYWLCPHCLALWHQHQADGMRLVEFVRWQRGAPYHNEAKGT